MGSLFSKFLTTSITVISYLRIYHQNIGDFDHAELSFQFEEAWLYWLTSTFDISVPSLCRPVVRLAASNAYYELVHQSQVVGEPGEVVTYYLKLLTRC